MAETKIFTVISPIHHNGESYAIGEKIELTAKEAAAMPLAAEPVKVKEKEKE